VDRTELIAKARALDPNIGSESALVDVLDTFAWHGVADEASGNVEAPCGHFFRVDRWLVLTDERGFETVDEYPTVDEAVRSYEELEDRYVEWQGESNG
jgi:hypothetical protein